MSDNSVEGERCGEKKDEKCHTWANIAKHMVSTVTKNNLRNMDENTLDMNKQ